MARTLYICVSVFLLLYYLNLSNGEVDYKAVIEESFLDCDDFENTFMDCSALQLDSSSASDASIFGTIDLSGQIEDQKISIDIYRKGDMADEFMFAMDGDICEHIGNTDAPWYEFFKSMNITGCPIVSGSYFSEHMIIDISSAKEVLNHDLCGKFGIVVKITTGDNSVLGCYVLNILIIEYELE